MFLLAVQTILGSSTWYCQVCPNTLQKKGLGMILMRVWARGEVQSGLERARGGVASTQSENQGWIVKAAAWDMAEFPGSPGLRNQYWP